MAVQRDRPYPQFNFVVDLGAGDTEGTDAGFQRLWSISHRMAGRPGHASASSWYEIRSSTGPRTDGGT